MENTSIKKFIKHAFLKRTEPNMDEHDDDIDMILMGANDNVTDDMILPSTLQESHLRGRIVRFHKKSHTETANLHDFLTEKSCISSMSVLKFFFVRFLCTKLSGKEGRGAKYDAG